MSHQPAIRILGIDPGSRVTGYGVLDQKGNKSIFVSCGVVRPKQKSFAGRLEEIYNTVGEIIETFKPERFAIEDVFVSVNPRSALKLGHARGVLLLAAAQHNLEIYEYTPRVIKQAVAGYGNATKAQIQQAVRALLSLSACPSQDAADALAISLCCSSYLDYYDRITLR